MVLKKKWFENHFFFHPDFWVISVQKLAKNGQNWPKIGFLAVIFANMAQNAIRLVPSVQLHHTAAARDREHREPNFIQNGQFSEKIIFVNFRFDSILFPVRTKF